MSLTKASKEVDHAKEPGDLTSVVPESVSFKARSRMMEVAYPKTNPPIDTSMPIQKPFHVSLGSGVLS
jgi:hypothetical protein